MILGVPKEIKDNEARVGITPAGVKALGEAGHKVLVETQAGAQSGFPDEEYQNAGAEIVAMPGTCGAHPRWWSRSKSPSSRSIHISAKDSFYSPTCTWLLCRS